jgi:hypothetical protein
VVGERVVAMGAGEFGAHIGFAPALKPEPDADYALEEYEKNQRFAGLGEQGRILGLYLQHKLIESKGYAEANQPFYNKKLWDDRNADFKAFTLRTVVDIGVTIAAAVFAPVTGGASLAASVALNLVDDAVFTLADIASGMEAGQAFGAFGKKALTSTATAAIGVGFNGFSVAQASFHGLAGAMGKFGKSVIGSTLLKGAEVATTNIATSAINAIDFTGIGSGDWFDTGAFTEGAFGKDALAGVAGGMAGNFVTAGLGKWNLETSAGTKFTGASGAIDPEALRSFNRLMGAASEISVEYWLSGNSTISLLNTGMIGLKDVNREAVDIGLLEYHFGDRGNYFNVGMEGTKVDMLKILQSLKGMDQTARITELRLGGRQGNAELETIAMWEYSSNKMNHLLARMAFNDEIDFELGNGISSEGVRYRGLFQHDKPTTLTFSQAMLGKMSQEDYAILASLMSHEGSHLLGNRVESIGYLLEQSTYQELTKNLGLQGDREYVEQLYRSLQDASSWEPNTGGIDYAEWYISKDAIGIRRTTFSDLVRDLPLIGGALRGIDLFFGMNPYTDRKLPESSVDERRYAEESRRTKDRLNVALFIAGLFTAGASEPATGLTTLSGTTQNFAHFLGKVFSLNPKEVKSILDAAGIASNYIDIAMSAAEFLASGRIKTDQAQGFQAFKNLVMDTESFRDIKGYRNLDDKAIFALAEKAGIALQVENKWVDQLEMAASAVNEMMNRFNFVSALHQLGVNDANVVRELYFQGVPYSYTDQRGLVWWLNNPGFAESNGYLTEDYIQNRSYQERERQISRLRVFNVMRAWHNSGKHVDLGIRSTAIMDDIYRDMMDSYEYMDLNKRFLQHWRTYSYDFFQVRR